MYVVGIDLGGTKISCALASIDGDIVSQYVTPTEAEQGEMHIVENMRKAVEQLLEQAIVTIEDVEVIGIGAPGPLDAERGIILEPANLPFNNFNIVEPLKRYFNKPIFLENDANVAALGEWKFGAGKGCDHMVYFTVSTGIGGGAVLNGKLYHGRTSNALELGHTTVDPFSQVRCGCGNLGCLEAHASGTAIAKRAREAVLSNVSTALKNYDHITAAEVFKEASLGDRVAIDIRDTAFNYLGIGITNAINTFDPDVVIIGGGVSQVGEVLFDAVKALVKQRGLKTMTDGCKILPAQWGTDAGIIGAIALALTHVTEYKKDKEVCHE